MQYACKLHSMMGCAAYLNNIMLLRYVHSQFHDFKYNIISPFSLVLKFLINILVSSNSCKRKLLAVYICKNLYIDSW